MGKKANDVCGMLPGPRSTSVDAYTVNFCTVVGRAKKPRSSKTSSSLTQCNLQDSSCDFLEETGDELGERFTPDDLNTGWVVGVCSEDALEDAPSDVLFTAVSAASSSHLGCCRVTQTAQSTCTDVLGPSTNDSCKNTSITSERPPANSLQSAEIVE